MSSAFAAVDLGATSGRVILGRLLEGRFTLEHTARFRHDPLPVEGELHWNVSRLLDQSRAGIIAADRISGGLDAIGVDTWAVDYGLLGHSGHLLGDPYHYRDARTQGIVDQVLQHIPAVELYQRCGLQVQPFNTIFQLVAAASDTDWTQVSTLLLMPDIVHHWLTGRSVAEVTNASTTGLLDPTTRRWSTQTLADLERYWSIAPGIVPELVEPGTLLGPVHRAPLDSRAQVVAVGSHDTASAVVAVPAARPDFAYISSGTWSLVGLELDAPVLTEASRAANFTNELGVDNTVRYLKNVMGLWVLTESINAWHEAGLDVELPALLEQAGRLDPLVTVVDINDPALLPPGDMPTRLAALAADSGERVPQNPAQFTRCILDSLALAYRVALRQACALAHRDAGVLHIVGGGSNNALLCQLSAEATGLDVVAGPSEGAALGNLLVQARTCGALHGGLPDLRKVAVASSELHTYHPGVLDGMNESAWRAAEVRIRS